LEVLSVLVCWWPSVWAKPTLVNNNRPTIKLFLIAFIRLFLFLCPSQSQCSIGTYKVPYGLPWERYEVLGKICIISDWAIAHTGSLSEALGASMVAGKL